MEKARKKHESREKKKKDKPQEGAEEELPDPMDQDQSLPSASAGGDEEDVDED